VFPPAPRWDTVIYLEGFVEKYSSALWIVRVAAPTTASPALGCRHALCLEWAHPRTFRGAALGRGSGFLGAWRCMGPFTARASRAARRDRDGCAGPWCNLRGHGGGQFPHVGLKRPQSRGSQILVVAGVWGEPRNEGANDEEEKQHAQRKPHLLLTARMRRLRRWGAPAASVMLLRSHSPRKLRAPSPPAAQPTLR